MGALATPTACAGVPAATARHVAAPAPLLHPGPLPLCNPPRPADGRARVPGAAGPESPLGPSPEACGDKGRLKTGIRPTPHQLVRRQGEQ